LRQPLTERYREPLAGVLSWLRPDHRHRHAAGACYAKGMTGFLSAAAHAAPRIMILKWTKADKIACSRGFVYMVNSWLMRDSLHWGLGRIAPPCLGSPPSPSDERWPLCSILSIRVAASEQGRHPRTRQYPRG
jgi:hypothetical protein